MNQSVSCRWGHTSERTPARASIISERISEHDPISLIALITVRHSDLNRFAEPSKWLLICCGRLFFGELHFLVHVPIDKSLEGTGLAVCVKE